MELPQFWFRELHTHLVKFFHAHTMFAGNGSPCVYTELEYLPPELFGSAKLIRLASIVKN